MHAKNPAIMIGKVIVLLDHARGGKRRVVWKVINLHWLALQPHGGYID